MSQTAESHSATIPTNRNCTIEISNNSGVYCLISPKVHMESGYPFSPPQPTIPSTQSEICSFTKEEHTATGAVGVLTYELFNMRNKYCTELLAIMFSVPFDHNIYDNWLGVGIFEPTRACDKKLFHYMYHDRDITDFVRQEATGSEVMYSGTDLAVRVCMGGQDKAIIKLELYDKMG